MKNVITKNEMQSIQNLIYAVTKASAIDIRNYRIFVDKYGTEFKDKKMQKEFEKHLENFEESKEWLLSSDIGVAIFEKLMNESIQEAEKNLRNMYTSEARNSINDYAA